MERERDQREGGREEGVTKARGTQAHPRQKPAQ
jgi:hypothetical protein